MSLIETTDDLIRLLREDEEFREAARREILTSEFLKLPAQVADLAAQVANLTVQVADLTVQVAQLSKQFTDFAAKTDARLSALENDVAVLKEDVRVLKEDVRVLKEDVAVLKEDGRVLKVDVGQLKGDSMEAKLERKGRSKIAFALRLRRTRVLRVTDDSRGSEDFTDALWDAQSAGLISEREYERILDTDMILKCQRADARELDVYVVVEASYTSNGTDRTRALRSAQILRNVFPESEVIPALFYAEISEQDLSAAHDAGVVTVADN